MVALDCTGTRSLGAGVDSLRTLPSSIMESTVLVPPVRGMMLIVTMRILDVL